MTCTDQTVTEEQKEWRSWRKSVPRGHNIPSGWSRRALGFPDLGEASSPLVVAYETTQSSGREV